ncbi:response regulator transcription factor [Granulicella arctica]|uniref:response regulator transcription factor n=1 Tax=Granulicella arctica TaxID=940613 RepID=UPI0021E007A5|nr:response regulator transcription factor [Granulicella arctica]
MTRIPSVTLNSGSVPLQEPIVLERPKILLIDDDQELCQLLRTRFASEGLDLKTVFLGKEGLRCALESSFALIVLDVMLPDTRGFDVLRELRKHTLTPVIMLTAQGDEVDRILGLELGADDYLPKPFSTRELLARMTAILRRSAWKVPFTAGKPPKFLSGDLEIDLALRIVLRNGEQIKLTSTEFDLTRSFCEAPGEVLTRELLVVTILERTFVPFDRSIDLHISNLRRKLGPRPDGYERIQSVRGIGYLYVWPA